MRQQHIGRGRESGSCIADIELGIYFGQGSDAIAVAIKAQRLRRARQTEQARIVGHVGVDAFGEIVQQQIVAARRPDFRHQPCVGSMQWSVDRLEVIEFRRRAEQKKRLSQYQGDGSGGDRLAASAAGKRGGHSQRHQQRRDQPERVQHKHERQHERRADARTGQVIAVDAGYVAVVQHEAQRHIQAGGEKERQQAKVIQRDIFNLRPPGRRVLQLQRIKRIDRGKVEADRPRQHQHRRQECLHPVAMPEKNIAEQRQHDAAQRETDHHDGDHPVAVFGPFRDGEIPRQGNFHADRAGRDQE